MTSERPSAEDPAYVVWDTGCVEYFDTQDDAEHELQAVRSRGLEGRMFTDLEECIKHMGTLEHIHFMAINPRTHDKAAVREVADIYTWGWDACVPGKFRTVALLVKEQEEDDEDMIFGFVSYIEGIPIRDVKLEEISEVLREEVSPEAIYKKALTKVANALEPVERQFTDEEAIHLARTMMAMKYELLSVLDREPKPTAGE